MHIRKLSLIALLLLIGLSVYAQYNNTDIVQDCYPQIYTSIKNQTEKISANDPKLGANAMEVQATAFIYIAEAQLKIDAIAMANALLFGSLEGEQEYNQKVIDDLGSKSPYPLLRCNWYKVKDYYDKTKNPNLSSVRPVAEYKKPETPAENNGKNNNYIDEVYTSARKYTQKDKAAKKNTISEKERVLYQGGISLDFIYSNITGLNNWGRNANPGKGLELRFWARPPVSKRFFLMPEMSAQFIHHFINDSDNKLSGNLNQSYFKYSCYFGTYKCLSPTATLLIGAGGFGGLNFSTSGYYDRNEEDAYPSSEDLNTFNYGFSGLIGIQNKRYEFSLRGDWGMADMSQEGYKFYTRTIALSVGYCFNLF